MSSASRASPIALALVFVMLLSIPLLGQTPSNRTFLDTYWSLAQVTTSSKQAGANDGYMWLTLTRPQRELYLQALVEGFFSSALAVVGHAQGLYCAKQGSCSTTIGEVFDFSEREVKAPLVRALGSLTFEQIALGVDRFYNDAQNLRRPVLDAVISLARSR